jgi:hypothetical protein
MRLVASSKARRCTRFVIWRAVILSASAVVIPFSSNTLKVCEIASTVCETANGAVNGTRRSRASVDARPGSVLYQRQLAMTPNTAATTRMTP